MREIFIRKLTKYTRSLHLPPQYTSLFCLTALDINVDVYKFAKQQFQRCITFRKQLVDRIGELKVEPALILPEYILPYVIHLLAYDEELSSANQESRRKAEKCIWFTLEPIVQKTNRYSFFMKLLNTIKSTCEAVLDTPESTERLHSICDLVGKILTTKVHQICTDQYKDPILLPKHLYKQGEIPAEESAEFVGSPPGNHTVMDAESTQETPQNMSVGGGSTPVTPSEEPMSTIQENTVDTDNTDFNQETINTSDSSSPQTISGKKRKRAPSDAFPDFGSSSTNSEKSGVVRKSQRKRM